MLCAIVHIHWLNSGCRSSWQQFSFNISCLNEDILRSCHREKPFFLALFRSPLFQLSSQSANIIDVLRAFLVEQQVTNNKKKTLRLCQFANHEKLSSYQIQTYLYSIIQWLDLYLYFCQIHQILLFSKLMPPLAVNNWINLFRLHCEWR